MSSVASTNNIVMIDSLHCKVSIETIKKANVKLLERKSLLELVEVQEERNEEQKALVLQQSFVIDTLQNRIINNINDYNNLVVDYQKQQQKIKTWKIAGCVSVGIIGVLLILK